MANLSEGPQCPRLYSEHCWASLVKLLRSEWRGNTHSDCAATLRWVKSNPGKEMPIGNILDAQYYSSEEMIVFRNVLGQFEPCGIPIRETGRLLAEVFDATLPGRPLGAP